PIALAHVLLDDVRQSAEHADAVPLDLLLLLAVAVVPRAVCRERELRDLDVRAERADLRVRTDMADQVGAVESSCHYAASSPASASAAARFSSALRSSMVCVSQSMQSPARDFDIVPSS